MARSLLNLARPYPWVLPSLVTLGILASLAEGLGIGLLIPVFEAAMASAGSQAPSSPFVATIGRATAWIPLENRMAILGALILLLVGIKTVIMVANSAVSVWISDRVAHDLRVDLAEAMLTSDYAYVSRLEPGQLVSLMETQTYRVGEAVTLLAGLISASCTILVFAVLLGLLSWQLALVVLAVVLPVSLAVRVMSGRSQRLGQALVQAYARLSARVLELVSSVRTIRLFNGERAERTRFAASSEEVRRTSFRTGTFIGAIQPFVEFLYVPVFLAVFAYAVAANVGLPTMLTFLALLYRLQTPLKRLDHARVALSSYSTAIEQVEELRGAVSRYPARTGSCPAAPLSAAIEFQDVGFTYLGALSPALDGVSFTIRRGEVVAITGASGSGKSTLVNLLCGLYEPSHGRIVVDGTPLQLLDSHSWRAKLAFSGQDADLLDGSIRDNVTLGLQDVGDARVEIAIRQARADGFVSSLPGGLDAPVGVRGRNLSGGQRQRIALARAFVREPDVLILDEATNAVDNVTEAEIQQTIDALAGRCTIIVIAHRLTTLRRVHRAIVLDRGRIVELGTPAELLDAGGFLARQYNLE